MTNEGWSPIGFVQNAPLQLLYAALTNGELFEEALPQLYERGRLADAAAEREEQLAIADALTRLNVILKRAMELSALVEEWAYGRNQVADRKWTNLVLMHACKTARKMVDSKTPEFEAKGRDAALLLSPLATSGLCDPDHAVRMLAIEATGLLGPILQDGDATEDLLELLASEDPAEECRMEALKALFALRTPRAAERLYRAAAKLNPRDRTWEAVMTMALAMTNDRERALLLLQPSLDRLADFRTRCLAARLLLLMVGTEDEGVLQNIRNVMSEALKLGLQLIKRIDQDCWDEDSDNDIATLLIIIEALALTKIECPLWTSESRRLLILLTEELTLRSCKAPGNDAAHQAVFRLCEALDLFWIAVARSGAKFGEVENLLRSGEEVLREEVSRWNQMPLWAKVMGALICDQSRTRSSNNVLGGMALEVLSAWVKSKD